MILRMLRNLITISRTVDRGSMYTRFYPIGKEDLQLPEKYVDKNTAQYGVVCRVETDSTLDTVAELREWARQRLAKHAEPTVTDDVEGLELADATGESLDRFQICRMCRVPLPDFGTTITERIVQKNYPDKLHNPEKVRVTMGNARNDVVRIIADNMKKGGKSARASTKKDKEDRAWFEDTNDHVSMCAKGIIGVDARGNPNWVRLSSFVADGTGLHASVESVQNGLTKAESRIEINEYEIATEVTKRTREGTYLQSQINQQKDKISLVVQEKNGQNVVNAAKIVAAVNNGSSSIKLTADHIDIDGIVSKLSTYSVKTWGITSTSAEFAALKVFGHPASWQTLTFNKITSLSTERAFCYGSTSGVSGTVTGRIVLNYESTTIHYLGR